MQTSANCSEKQQYFNFAKMECSIGQGWTTVKFKKKCQGFSEILHKQDCSEIFRIFASRKSIKTFIYKLTL